MVAELWDNFFPPHHMNSIFVEAWDAFKVSAGNIIRDSFVKTMLLLLIPHELTINSQACAASIQVASEPPAKEINNRSCPKVAPIELQVTRNDDPMVVLQAKGMQQSSRNTILRYAAYGAVIKGTAIPIK